jgi:hypothetical protein
VSNVGRIRSGSVSGEAAGSLPFRPPADNEPGGFPSAAGTAVLNLTGDQASRIRKLLIGLRTGKSAAAEVREHIFAMLSGAQRRMLGAAYFIISVRV